MKFAQKMRELRDGLGLSEAKLAELSGVPFGTIHEYGLGRRMPSFAAVVQIAKALGVECTAFADCEDIRSGSESEKKPTPKKPPTKKGKKQV